jgi:pyruvate dehydrogenase complex dehydrogenase (E1) component
MGSKDRLVGFIIVAALGPLAAHATRTEAIVNADTKAAFAAVAADVKQQMAHDGRYEFVNANEREVVEARLTDMQTLFQKFGDVAQMGEAARTQLFNDQEEVNAILTRRDDKRLVCENTTPLGSHIPRRTCQTYRQAMIEQRGAQEYMSKSEQVPALKKGG